MALDQTYVETLNLLENDKNLKFIVKKTQWSKHVV